MLNTSSISTYWFFVFAAEGTEQNQGVKKVARDAMSGNTVNNGTNAGLSLDNSVKTEASKSGDSNVTVYIDNDITNVMENALNEYNNNISTDISDVFDNILN